MARWHRPSLIVFILLVVWGWATSSSLQARGLDGQGQPRFTRAENGVITDRATGLEWYVGQENNWHQAKAWVESLNVAGGGWRLPTVAELQAIYQPGASANNMDPLFQTSVAWAWSSELNQPWSVWGLAFYNGVVGWHSMNYGNGRLALAVRAHK